MVDSIDKRKGLDPIPENLNFYLSEEQLRALPGLERRGISVFAVRRPLFQEPVVIMKFLSRRGYGVLLKNGDVDYFPDIVVRGKGRSKVFPSLADEDRHDGSVG